MRVYSNFSKKHLNKSSAAAEKGDHLATTDTGRKIGGCCAPFFGGIGEGRKPKQNSNPDADCPGKRSKCFKVVSTAIPTQWPHHNYRTGLRTCVSWLDICDGMYENRQH